MKKVLLTLIAVLMAVPAFAIEVYNNGGDTSVEIYGTLRGYIGYGHGMDSTNDSTDDNLLYGLQGNSRIGTRFKVGNFSGQVELGANEKTLYSGSTKDTVGLRQAWGAYTFGNAGTLLAGKTDTPTTMSGFSADIMDTDSGLKGFGGNGTGNRRFQVAYRVMGLDIALIENDMAANKGSISGSFVAGTDNYGNDIYANRYEDGGEVIPRIAIAYTYKADDLLAKIGATYTALNGRILDATTDTRWTTIHAFGVVAGIRPTFLDGRMWLSIQARYGMNEHLYGEATTVFNGGSFGHKTIDVNPNLESDGTVNNVSRANVGLELGYRVTEQFSAILGGGYQITMHDIDGFKDINSYGVYLQAPYAINQYFALVPQVSYLATEQDSETRDAVVLAMQIRFTF